MSPTAAKAIRNVNPTLQIGIVHLLRLFDPATPAARDVAVAALWDYLFNTVILQALRTGRVLPPFGNRREWPALHESCDFFGLNYYTRERVAFDARQPGLLFGRRYTPADVLQSEVGFEGKSYGEIYPAGLYRALRRAASLQLPIYITETGLPDADDDQRPGFILDHLAAAHRAIQDGVICAGSFSGRWSITSSGAKVGACASASTRSTSAPVCGGFAHLLRYMPRSRGRTQSRARVDASLRACERAPPLALPATQRVPGVCCPQTPCM